MANYVSLRKRPESVHWQKLGTQEHVFLQKLIERTPERTLLRIKVKWHNSTNVTAAVGCQNA